MNPLEVSKDLRTKAQDKKNHALNPRKGILSFPVFDTLTL